MVESIALAIMQAFCTTRHFAYLISGIACFLLLLIAVTLYYTGQFTFALPWVQRSLFALSAIWLAMVDYRAPKMRVARKA